MIKLMGSMSTEADNIGFKFETETDRLEAPRKNLGALNGY